VRRGDVELPARVQHLEQLGERVRDPRHLDPELAQDALRVRRVDPRAHAQVRHVGHRAIEQHPRSAPHHQA